MTIEQIKIRAKIEIGDAGGASLTVETPYILAFSVTKQRGSISSFNARIKVSHSSVTGSIGGGGGYIKIYDGVNSPTRLIFTGIIENMQITPVFDDPSFVNINLSGSDTLRLLAGKKFTRRCRSTKATWVSITGVVRESLKSGKFKYVKQNLFDIGDGDYSSLKVVQTSALSAPKEVPTFSKGTIKDVKLKATPYSEGD
jgi:hypothetical protein